MAPCPQPFRLRAFYYAMAHFAREEYLKVHNVHPSQHKSGPAGGGTEIQMPGGVIGTKR